MAIEKVTFIGAGNMASSIIGGLIESGYSPELLTASDPSSESLVRLRNQFGITTLASNQQAVAEADVILLAVKPQVMKPVASDLAGSIRSNAMVISIAAGITIESLATWLQHDCLIRSMPNTPALVNQGVSGLFATDSVTTTQRTCAETIFSSVGMAFWVEQEQLIDAVTALSGSGPAYFFRLMELMTESAIKMGIAPEIAEKAVIQTCLGAANLAKSSDDNLSTLRQKVTSPGGTTERALLRFEQEGLAQIVDAAMNDCAERAQELANELGAKK